MTRYLVTIARSADIAAVRAALAGIGTLDDDGCCHLPRLVGLVTDRPLDDVHAVLGVAHAMPDDTPISAATVQTFLWAPAMSHADKGNVALAAMSSDGPLDFSGSTQTYGYDRVGDGVDIYLIDARPDSVNRHAGRWVEIYSGYGGTGPGVHSFVFAPLIDPETGVSRGSQPIRVAVAFPDDGFGTTSGIVTAAVDAILADYAGRATLNRPAVCNMSLYGSGITNPFEAAVDAMIDAGIVVVAAAGNESGPNPSKYLSYDWGAWPAAMPDVIGVGNCIANGKRVGSSNYGAQTEIYAVGGALYDQEEVQYAATVWGIDGLVKRVGNGTSTATPHVTGALACLLDGYGRLRDRADVLVVKAALLDMAIDGAVADVPEGPTRALHKPAELGADPLGIPDLWLGGAGTNPPPIDPWADEGAMIAAQAAAYVNANPTDTFVQAAIQFGGFVILGASAHE